MRKYNVLFIVKGKGRNTSSEVKINARGLYEASEKFYDFLDEQGIKTSDVIYIWYRRKG